MEDYKYNVSRVIDYVFNTKKALNFDVLFADGTGMYRQPEEPEVGSHVKLRFRTQLNNVDNVYIVCNGERHMMTLDESDELFDYYAYTIPEVNGRIDNNYEIQAGNVTCYYNKLGAQMNLNHDYDFQLMPGYKVPEWAKGAVFYQIFVDRFCNGDTSNDVLDNEYCYIGEGTKRITDWDKL